MSYFSQSLLGRAALLSLIVVACDNPFREESRDFIMRAKIAKINLASHNFTIDRKTRRANTRQAATALSQEYPAAPPFPKDTTDSIFVPRIPATMRGIKLESKKFAYVKPTLSPDLIDIFQVKKISEKPYYSGQVIYLSKTKKLRRATGVVVSDGGYCPEWALTWIYDELFKGEGDELFGSLVPGFEFEKTVEYKGHTWGVWVPGALLKKYTKSDPYTAIFTTQWNSRFIVAQIDVDTAAANLETFYQLVNVPYLDKLRSPERQKHVMPN